MKTKDAVVISNYWHRPGIKVSIFHNEDAPSGAIRLEITMSDFLLALGKEINHPLTLLTRSQLDAALQRAASAAIEKIKESSTSAMITP